VHWFKSDPAQPFAIDEDKSHIKFMVIDEELVVLGSSNLDRASACTSGEVNIAISNADLAKQIVSTIQHHQLTGRLNV
jgi:phosphatidylserine/phosphatidylglycerophosphate/cardiolipin synthase-like enzyme